MISPFSNHLLFFDVPNLAAPPFVMNNDAFGLHMSASSISIFELLSSTMDTIPLITGAVECAVPKPGPHPALSVGVLKLLGFPLVLLGLPSDVQISANCNGFNH